MHHLIIVQSSMMTFIRYVLCCSFLFVRLGPGLGTSILSLNQPKLCSSATWHSNASTFADVSTVGVDPHGIFIDRKDTIYVADKSNHRIRIWTGTNRTLTQTISDGLFSPYAVFASIHGDVYIDHGSNGSVLRWSANTNTTAVVMNVSGICYGLFLDSNETLYCSMIMLHRVVKQSMTSPGNGTAIAAGTGSGGSSAFDLHYPYGIFVDTNFTLFVADCSNHRIQRFSPDDRNGTTVAGVGAPGTVTLSFPTAVALDAEGYLFIVDKDNHRVVGQSLLGFRCIVGCSGTNGSAANQLRYPWSLSFDSYANIYIADMVNSRIQQFALWNNSCGKR